MENINNRFDLILKAAKRARQIQITNQEKILSNETYKPKCTVLALKELENHYLNSLNS